MKNIKTIVTIAFVATIGFFAYSLLEESKPSLFQEQLNYAKRVIVADNFFVEKSDDSEFETLVGFVSFDSSDKYRVGEKFVFGQYKPSNYLPSKAIIIGYEESLSPFYTRFLYEDISRTPEDNKMNFNQMKKFIDEWYKNKL